VGDVVGGAVTGILGAVAVRLAYRESARLDTLAMRILLGLAVTASPDDPAASQRGRRNVARAPLSCRPDLVRRRANIVQVLGSDGAAVADLETALGQQHSDRIHVDRRMPMESRQSGFAHRSAEVDQQ
jgi:hypothetical protein